MLTAPLQLPKRLVFLLFPLVIFATSCFAAERVQCASLKSRILAKPVGYCAMLPPSYDAQPGTRFPVLYFLHGLGGDQSFLVSSGGWTMIEDAWEQKHFPEFVLITPNADTSFYINAKSGQVRYEDFFIREFVPAMEKKFRLQATRKGRAISGVSMGGYGALRFAFKYPQMFSSVAGVMPALLEQLPRGSQNAGFTAFFGTAFGSPVDEAFWKANTPFVYARTANLAGLKIYVDCGDQDNYGFDGGARALDKLLTARRVAHLVHIYPGQHDWQFVAQHLLESLKFQAQAFGK
ncbi:MAG TPA: alpha/beta hydrolase family protein [Candidatus Angelobacter sp.]|nr:alpha/beta hydrolase family protein [Candidatus Angelobacter sp.]